MASGYSSSRDSANRKRALLIGNNQYKKQPQLQFCTNDAEDLAKKLRSIDFEVTININTTCEQMYRMIDDFSHQICPGDLVLFFFAGHAYQYNEQNFLIPIDNDRIEKDTDLKYRAINAQAILDKIMSCRPSAAIFLLDCSGLSNMQAVAGSFIAFACGANQTASDGSPNGRNSIFTAHLLRHITQPNLTIDKIMYDVCDGVMKDTNGRQCPFRLSSLQQRVCLNQELQPCKFPFFQS